MFTGTLDIKGLQSLETLKYQTNQPDAVITLEYNKLKALDLSGNRLDYFPEIIFKNNETLENLMLNNNLFKNITKFTFKELRKLKHLDMHDNYVKHLEEFSLPSLITLNFNNNSLENYPKKGFLYSNLTKLSLTKNFVGEKSPDLFPRVFFKDLNSIKELDFAINNEFLPDPLFDNLKDLETLKLLLTFHANFFNQTSKWNRSVHQVPQVEVDVFNPELFQFNTNLRKLTIEIEDLAGKMDEVSKLFNMDALQFSKFKMPADPFRNLKKLEYLHLISLGLSYISGDALLHQTKLLDVDLSLNNFQNSIPGTLFRNSPLLLKIRIETSNLKYINENLFSSQGQVLDINLSWNKLETLPEKLFLNNTKLLKLNISGNLLETLPANIFDPLESLIILDVSSNKFKMFSS